MEMTILKRRIRDIVLLVCAALPIVGAIVLKILTNPASEGVSVSGARVYCEIRWSIVDIYITESQVNSLAVILGLFFLILFLTRDLKPKAESTRQVICEWIVEKTENLVQTNMGEFFSGYGPFIAAIMGISAMSSFCSLFGLFAPTSDVNIIAGWAILVFILITYYKMKCGPWHYVKSFADPIAVMAPMNVISEVATPVSMTFRHYGNVLSGSVISILIGTVLQKLSSLVLGWIPGFLGEFPLLRIGIPAVFSIYFDLFSGGLQAFIFAMLTMLYISGGFPYDDYQIRKAKKAAKKKAQSETN